MIFLNIDLFPLFTASDHQMKLTDHNNLKEFLIHDILFARKLTSKAATIKINGIIAFSRLVFSKTKVKVQFRGLELYKETDCINKLNKEASDPPRIFGASILDWHTFHHVYVAFWCRIFFFNMARRRWNIGKNTMSWLLLFHWWYHNAGVRELFEQSGCSIESRCAVKPITCCYTMTTMPGSKTIHRKSYHQFIFETVPPFS